MRTTGELRRHDLLDLGSEPAEPDRVFAHDDGLLHERPRTDPRPRRNLITDPAYTFGYSQFCYELPFMPGTTQYLDTPVVPTSAFAGAGYNNVDCNYPALTPAIAKSTATRSDRG
jgi:hypothetical protein